MPSTLAPLTAGLLGGLLPLQGPDPQPGQAVILQTREFDVGGLAVTAELGRLYVPENRADPESNLIELAFGRFMSPAPDPRPPLVYLAGGPGSSATSIAESSAALAQWRPVIEVCDLILLDQRGTGRSRPRLVWDSDEDPPTDLFAGTEGRALEYALRRSRAAAQHFRDQGVDLAGYTTVQSADDLDDLRKALGLEKISLFGFSYGTHLGLATIRRHGEHLQDVVLVGTEAPHQTHKFPSNADTQLRKLSLLVAEDPVVGLYVPDLIELLERVLDKLDRQPLVVTVTDRQGRQVEVPVGRFGLQMILRFDIGDRSDLVVFPKLLYSIDQGDPSVLQWFVQKRFRQLGPINAMSMVMDGASGAPPGRWERIESEAERSLLGNTMNFPYPAINQAWDTPDLGDEFRAPIVSGVRTLFLSGSLDWNTPPYQAEMVRFGFTSASHVIVEGAGHEQIISHPQAAQAIARFLRGEHVPSSFAEMPPLRFVPIDGYDPQVTHPSASLGLHLVGVYENQGLDAAIDTYRALRARHGLDGEADVNAFGYALLQRGAVEDAIAVFEMNVEDHPDSWNVYDSLAEAYKVAGDRDRSIELYRKSLEINPGNENGLRMLEDLGAR